MDHKKYCWESRLLESLKDLVRSGRSSRPIAWRQITWKVLAKSLANALGGGGGRRQQEGKTNFQLRSQMFTLTSLLSSSFSSASSEFSWFQGATFSLMDPNKPFLPLAGLRALEGYSRKQKVLSKVRAQYEKRR